MPHSAQLVIVYSLRVIDCLCHSPPNWSLYIPYETFTVSCIALHAVKFQLRTVVELFKVSPTLHFRVTLNVSPTLHGDRVTQGISSSAWWPSYSRYPQLCMVTELLKVSPTLHGSRVTQGISNSAWWPSYSRYLQLCMVAELLKVSPTLHGGRVTQGISNSASWPSYSRYLQLCTVAELLKVSPTMHRGRVDPQLAFIDLHTNR